MDSVELQPPSYAPVLNLEGDSRGFVKLRSDDLKAVIDNFLQYSYVDEEWYLKTYPDVSLAIAAGSIENANPSYSSHSRDSRTGTA